MNNTIIYGRCSTNDQENSEEMQESKCREYCNLQNLNIVDVIIESNTSRKTDIFKRRGLSNVRDAIDSGKIQNLVVYKLDRLGGSVIDCLTNMKYFKKNKVAVHFVSYGGSSLNTDSPIGEFIITTLSAISNLERAMISERTKDILDSLKKQGKRVGGIPVGMTVDKTVIGTKRNGKPKYNNSLIPDPSFDITKKIIMDNKDKPLRYIKTLLPHSMALGTINSLRAGM